MTDRKPGTTRREFLRGLFVAAGAVAAGTTYARRIWEQHPEDVQTPHAVVPEQDPLPLEHERAAPRSSDWWVRDGGLTFFPQALVVLPAAVAAARVVAPCATRMGQQLLQVRERQAAGALVRLARQPADAACEQPHRRIETTRRRQRFER